MDTDVRDALRSAADVIDERGWLQGSPTAARTRKVCVLYAISLAVKQDVNYLYERVKITLFDALKPGDDTFEPGDDVSGSLIAWNDRPGQTKENVVETLRRVADGQ